MAEETDSPFRYFPVIVLILVVQSAGVYFFLDRAIPKPDKEVAEVREERPSKEEIQKRHPYIVKDIEPVTINPATDEMGYLVRLAAQLGVDSKSARRKAEENKIRVQDSLVRALAPRTIDQLRGSSREEMKKAIQDELNKWLGGHVVEIYFTAFVIQ